MNLSSITALTNVIRCKYREIVGSRGLVYGSDCVYRGCNNLAIAKVPCILNSSVGVV